MATYYTTPTASSTGLGTYDNPINAFAALVSKMVPGDTLVFKPGIYPSINVPLKLKGSPENLTTLKSEEKWGAIIQGSVSSHGIATSDNTHYIKIDGFKVQNSYIDGIKLNGSYGIICNCWVTSSSGQGISSHGYTGNIVENNLVEYNGTRSGLDHGIYFGGSNHVFRNNVIRYNRNYGIQLWDTGQDYLIENNLLYGQGGIVIGKSKNNIVRNNTIVENVHPFVFYNLVPDGSTIICNNIISCTVVGLNTIDGVGDLSSIVFNNNIFVEKPQLYTGLKINLGPSNLFATDPLFVDKINRLYFITNNSPAIGKSGTYDAPDNDFWGNAYNVSSTIGCFPYYPILEKQVATNFDFNNYWKLDVINPSVFISNPGNGDTISGITTLTVEMSDNIGVTKVELYVDGQLNYTSNSMVSNIVFDTSTLGNGTHSFVIKAYDGFGNFGSNAYTYIVNNTVPTCKVSVLNMPTGTKIYQKSTSSIGIKKVEFYVDDNLISTTIKSDSSITTKLSTGVHKVKCIAYDLNNNIGISNVVTIFK